MADSPYKLLALYYDRLFEPVRKPMGRARRQILGDILKRTGAACDLACGTGTTAVEFARRGIRTYAMDASPLMCRLARRKARESGVRVRVLKADMRSFRLPEAVDLVTCEFDALNHVPHKADLDRVARAVARALRPGGYFFFDVNNRLAFQKVWTGTWWHELPGVVLVMHGGYDRRRQKGWSNAAWFIQKGKSWRRSTERIEQVAWTAAEIRQSLRRAGFSSIRFWEQAPFVREWKISPGFRTVLSGAQSAVAHTCSASLRLFIVRIAGSLANDFLPWASFSTVAKTAVVVVCGSCSYPERDGAR